MISDSPIEIEKEDKLHRYEFARQIAKGLAYHENTSESLVIGINGAWGSGKTSLMNFILTEIEGLSDSDPIIMRFNPWMFSGQEELQRIFLTQLYFKFYEGDKKMKGVAEKVKLITKNLALVKYLHKGAGELIQDIEKSFDNLVSEKELTSLKTGINEALISEKRKVYITIDDIDRLTPTEIIDIFQLVKLNGNFANTTYILSYDAKVVHTALLTLYKENGHRYLEKIVQVDYTVPFISREDLISVFEDRLKCSFDPNVRGIIAQSVKDFHKAEFTSFFLTIRDIIRFINALELRLPSIYNELSVQDFMALEALRVFDSSAYEFVQLHEKDLVLRYQGNQIGQTYKDDANRKKEIIESSNISDTSKIVIKALFGVTGTTHHSFTSYKKLIREKRIAQPKHFGRYFSLRLTSFEISEEKFQQFLMGSSEQRLSIAKDIQAQDLIFDFFNWIGIKMIRKQEDEYYKTLIVDSLRSLEFLNYQGRGVWGLESDFIMTLNLISKYFEHIKSGDIRFETILCYIDTKRGTLNMTALIVSETILSAYDKKKKGELYSNYRWYELFSTDVDSNHFIKRVKDIFKRELRKQFKNLEKNFEDYNRDEISFLFDHLYVKDKKLYDALTPALYNSLEYCIDLITVCATQRVVSGTSGTGFCLDRSSFYEGLNPDRVYEMLQEIELDSLDDARQKTARFFIHVYEKDLPENEFFEFESLRSMGRF